MGGSEGQASCGLGKGELIYIYIQYNEWDKGEGAFACRKVQSGGGGFRNEWNGQRTDPFMIKK